MPDVVWIKIGTRKCLVLVQESHDTKIHTTALHASLGSKRKGLRLVLCLPFLVAYLLSCLPLSLKVYCPIFISKYPHSKHLNYTVKFET